MPAEVGALWRPDGAPVLTGIGRRRLQPPYRKMWKLQRRLPAHLSPRGAEVTERVIGFSIVYTDSVGKKKREIMKRKDYESLAAFRYALRKFFRFSEEAAAARGLTIRQYQALLTIQGFPGKEEITIRDIAEWLQIRHHSAVGLVNRLVHQGFAMRKKGKRDRRKVCVRVTAKGRAILQKLAYINKQELRQLHLQSYLADLIS